MHMLGLIMALVFLALFFGPWGAMRRAMAAGDKPNAARALEAMRQASLARLLRTRTQFWRSGLAIVGVFMLLVIMYSGLGRPLEPP